MSPSPSVFPCLHGAPRTLVLWLLGLALLGCRSSAGQPDLSVSLDAALVGPVDAGSLPSDAALAQSGLAFCRRPVDDAVRDIFCGPEPAQIASLRALQDRLQISPLPAGVEASYDAGAPLDPNSILNVVVLLGHSTAQAGQLVSPINPRAILLGNETFMAFQRGVQQVELASQDRLRNVFNFYLLTFSQACNSAATGCTPGDLFTPAIESEWRAVAISDDEMLKNTSFDCRQCHQRARDTPMLLMRELQGPWTHFFSLDPAGTDNYPGPLTGRDLAQDYQRAKGDEPYAGLPAETVRHTVGFVLENVVDTAQPLFFDAPAIEAETDTSELDAGLPDGGTGQRRSPTWDEGYAAFKRGEQLALPYYQVRATDPAKQAHLTAAYRSYLAGQLPREQLPDLRDIHPDDPQRRAEIGLQTEPGATPAEALVQACGSCHNDVLDQSISRARFNVALSRMTRAELEVAIQRLQLPGTAALAMPPAEARALDAEARVQLVTYLRANVRSSADDALLEHAAAAGMAGGARL